MFRVLSAALLTVAMASCTSLPQQAPILFASSAQDDEDVLLRANTWEEVTLPLTITLLRPSRVTVQFQAELKSAFGAFVGSGPAATPISAPVAVRVVVGNIVARPGSVQSGGGLVAGGPVSHGIIAVADPVPAGTHKIQVQWQSAAAGARMRSAGIAAWAQDTNVK